MGAKWRTKFLGSNLSLCPTPLQSDSGGKAMNECMKSVFINEHPQDQWALWEESKESSDPPEVFSL
jgi:hypothetical protein